MKGPWEEYQATDTRRTTYGDPLNETARKFVGSGPWQEYAEGGSVSGWEAFKAKYPGMPEETLRAIYQDTTGLESPVVAPEDMLAGGLSSLGKGVMVALGDTIMEVPMSLAIDIMGQNNSGLAAIIGKRGMRSLGMDEAKDLLGQYANIDDRLTRLDVPDEIILSEKPSAIDFPDLYHGGGDLIGNKLDPALSDYGATYSSPYQDVAEEYADMYMDEGKMYKLSGDYDKVAYMDATEGGSSMMSDITADKLRKQGYQAVLGKNPKTGVLEEIAMLYKSGKLTPTERKQIEDSIPELFSEFDFLE